MTAPSWARYWGADRWATMAPFKGNAARCTRLRAGLEEALTTLDELGATEPGTPAAVERERHLRYVVSSLLDV